MRTLDRLIAWALVFKELEEMTPKELADLLQKRLVDIENREIQDALAATIDRIRRAKKLTPALLAEAKSLLAELGTGYETAYAQYFAPQKEGGKLLAATFAGTLVELAKSGRKVGISWDRRDEWGIHAAKNYVKYWVEDRWSASIQQGISDVIAGAMEHGWSLAKTINHLEKKLPKLLDAPAYTEKLAHHAVSVTRQAGRILAYQKMGYRKLVVRATISEQTCEFCLYMDGRIVSVEEMVDKLKGLQAAASIEEAKRFHAWAQDVKGWRGMSTSQLVSAGATFPPYHPKCYCQLVGYIEDRYEPVRVEYGEDAKDDELLTEYLKSYTPEELAVKVHNMRQRAKSGLFMWHPKNREEDWKKHWAGKAGSMSEMDELTLKTVGSPKYVTIGIYRPGRKREKPRVQMYFYGEPEAGISCKVVIDLEGSSTGMIRGSFPGRSADRTFQSVKRKEVSLWR